MALGSRTATDRDHTAVTTLADGALPTVIVIGMMKCGTSAMHELLAAHPDVAMSNPKELNFFNGPDRPPGSDAALWWRHGQWHRGVDWYAQQFDPTARVRGEASPAYTSPDFPEAAGRMAEVVPAVRLVYLVRDPFDRAVSQYRHHRRDGSERRSMEEALLDPGSQYVARSRYVERLAPYLEVFAREQILVVVQERLRARPEEVMRTVFEHVGVDPARWPDTAAPPARTSPEPADRCALRAAFGAEVSGDIKALKLILRDRLPEWRTPLP